LKKIKISDDFFVEPLGKTAPEGDRPASGKETERKAMAVILGRGPEQKGTRPSPRNRPSPPQEPRSASTRASNQSGGSSDRSGSASIVHPWALFLTMPILVAQQMMVVTAYILKAVVNLPAGPGGAGAQTTPKNSKT